MSAQVLRAAGPRLYHITAASNLESIRQHGLMSAHALAQQAGVPPNTLTLRKDRLAVGRATLNHQRPILRGLRAAHRVLDGHTPESWAAQLDRRVFLWPGRGFARFQASIARDLEIAVLALDTEKLIEACAEQIDLSPLNSGNFTQGGAHARRGDWLYVPLSAGWEAFAENRRRRGLKATRDSLRELSLRAPIASGLLQRLICPDQGHGAS